MASSKDTKDASQLQKQQQKRFKKVEPFFESKNKTSARWKPLISYVQKAPPEELHKFFNEHFYQIYGVFLDTFSAYEANCKKGKHSSSEIQELLLILNCVLTHLHELIKKKWQTRSIAGILEKVLYKENKANIRVAGFQLLLVFLESLQNPEPAHLDMFAASIDLGPLTTGYRNIKLRFNCLSAPDKTCILAPSSSPPTAEQAVKLWEILLDYVYKKPEYFEFWFDLIKSQFLTTFYPDVCQRVGIIKDNEGYGFRPLCPPQIHEMFVTHIEIWMQNPQIANLLWTTDENVQIMLEIYRQSCHMPIQFDDTIKKCINVFKNLFWAESSKIPPSVQPRLVEYRKFFLQGLAGIFTTDSPPNLSAQHISLCQEALSLFKQIFVEMYESLHAETQETLMYTVLNTTTTLLKDKKNVTLAENLASVMCDTVLFMWIRTKTRREELWAALKEGLSSVFHLQVPVVQTKLKLIQLTLVIKEKMYPKRQRRQNVNRKPDENTQPGTPPNDSPKVKGADITCPDTLPPLTAIEKDPNIADISWEQEDLLFVWKKVLSIFENVNFIKDAQIHSIGISCLTDTIDILIRAEEAIPYNAVEDKNNPYPLWLIDIFGPYLFEAAALPETYVRGKALAVGMLCRLLVRHHGPHLPLELYANFYATIYKCLKDHPNSSVSWEIIKRSNNIFSLALPGCNVLIPHYMAETKRVLSASSNAPRDVKTKAILVVSSLICYPNHLGALKMPAEPMKAGRAGVKPVSFEELKMDIKNVLIETANFDPDPEHKIMCIWALCVVIFEELYHSKNMALVKEIVKNVLPFCVFENALVARAALDGLSSLSLVYEELRCLEESIIHIIVEMLCSNIQRAILESRQQKSYVLKETLVADHFYCLLDWIMSCTTYIFDKKQVASKVFEAIEIGLLGQKLNSGIEAVANAAAATLEKGKKDKSKRMSVFVDPQSQANNLLGELKTNPSHGSAAIKEAAQILLIQLCNFLNNFPCKEGIEIMSSQIGESDDINEISPPPLFYIYNDFALLSLVEIPLPDGTGTHSRIILRDSTGKYAWDSKIVYKYPTQSIPDPVNLFRLELADNFQEKRVEPPPNCKSLRKEGEPPTFLDSEGPPVDQVSELLKYLSESFPDCLPESNLPLDTPLQPQVEAHATNVENTRLALMEQAEEDDRALTRRKSSAPPPESWMVKPPYLPSPTGSYHNCRLFLSHLGFLSFDKQSSFCMVENSNRFFRSVAQLDKTSGREMLKIGLIYVKEGQDDQKVILRNDTKSPLYGEFVRGLGWPIDIKNHRGYLGGLDPHLTTGTTAPYYANSIMEVIFHEITYMPTNANDPQQITKKRHVGNDIVHIIYTEHVNDYDPATITSHFNDAHIIVYPLPNGLYRIQVYRKRNVQLFGPLLHGMCVNKSLLPVLVRQTAINANRYVRYNTGGYSRPFPTRRRALDEIVERFKMNRPYEELVSEIVGYRAPDQRQPQSSIDD